MLCDLTVEELFQAYYDCRKTKRNTWNALLFEENLERNLMDLYYELKSCTYRPGRSIMFVVTRPKPREVWAADFRDRVVHHVLYNRYAQTFYDRFIYDSYACIPGKGTLNAAKRLRHFMRSATDNNTRPAYFLKADVSNFFVSINKHILDNLLARQIVDPWWIWLTRIILHKDAKKDVYIKSSPKELVKVPRHKSLLCAPEGFGLPIGNLSSQFFANVYLNELDRYAKHTLKLKYYVRYVDDIVVLDKSGAALAKTYDKMLLFIKENLGLAFHPNKKEINLLNYGVNFVGYIIKPYSMYIRRSTISNLRDKARKKTDFGRMRAVINSYFGMLIHADAYKERVRVAEKLKADGYVFDNRLTKIKSHQCLSA